MVRIFVGQPSAKACFGETAKIRVGLALHARRVRSPEEELARGDRRGVQVGDDGGLLSDGQIGATGHAANEMWPFISRIFGDRWQSVTFETAGNEQVAAGCEIFRARVIGAGICNQGWSNCGWRGKVRTTNDK